MAIIDVLTNAELDSSSAISVFSLGTEPGRDTLIDYRELAVWLDREISEKRISPMIRVNFALDKSFDYCIFDKDFFCLFLRETPLNRVRFLAGGYLIFRLILSGEMTQKSGSESTDMTGFSASILSPSDAALGWTAHSSGSPGVTGIVIFCRAEILAKRLEYLDESSSSAVSHLHDRSELSYSKIVIPCTQGMIRLGNELIGTDLESNIARLRCEGMALLMMSEFLHSYGLHADIAGSTIQISGRDVQRLNEARDLIVRHYSEDLTISKLCRRVGLNRNKLTEGFRELFGSTVQGFVVEQRMHAAQEFVRNELPLEQVAELVGYSSSASFVRAFKKYFGVPPRKFASAAYHSFEKSAD